MSKLKCNFQISLEKSHSAPSTSLYQTLCHPCIVSLFSAFSTSNHRFQVLELCSGGSLSAFLTAHEHGALNEGQTRSVLKSLVNALGYLKKSCIIHRNINPENVLLTEQCRIVSTFSLFHYSILIYYRNFLIQIWQYVSHLKTTPQLLLSLAQNTSPRKHQSIYSTQSSTSLLVFPHREFLSRRPYDYSIDLWSLGCLVYTCLAGRPPFQVCFHNQKPTSTNSYQGPSTDEIFENILHGRYTMTKITSTLAANLISSLIQVVSVGPIRMTTQHYWTLFSQDPTKRQDLSSISHDAFLDPRLSDIPSQSQ